MESIGLSNGALPRGLEQSMRFQKMVRHTGSEHPSDSGMKDGFCQFF